MWPKPGRRKAANFRFDFLKHVDPTCWCVVAKGINGTCVSDLLGHLQWKPVPMQLVGPQQTLGCQAGNGLQIQGAKEIVMFFSGNVVDWDT